MGGTLKDLEDSRKTNSVDLMCMNFEASTIRAPEPLNSWNSFSLLNQQDTEKKEKDNLDATETQNPLIVIA